MKKFLFLAIMVLVSITVLPGKIIAGAEAGYKDHSTNRPCLNCGVPERHVTVQVIHKPRPHMLYIPPPGARQKVHIHYRHYYPQGRRPAYRIIDRRQPRTRAHHRQVVPVPSKPRGSVIREGLNRILGR